MILLSFKEHKLYLSTLLQKMVQIHKCWLNILSEKLKTALKSLQF